MVNFASSYFFNGAARKFKLHIWLIFVACILFLLDRAISDFFFLSSLDPISVRHLAPSLLQDRYFQSLRSLHAAEASG